MNEINIIDLKLDICQGTLSFILNCWVAVALVVLCGIIYYLRGKKLQKGSIHTKTMPIRISFNLLGQVVEYAIVRNYQNIEIAYRIHVELITRKAALPIDEQHDVITEVYNSWYTLFQTTREELKALSGELLLNNSVSNDLIRLLIDVLNKGLRPHLTEYQAKYRKWYNEALSADGNKGLSPQQIQMKYEHYAPLISSMKEVNQLLIEYAKKLNEIAMGRN
jgi:hypothetical protein